jgi:alkylhydroperoxidase family enzyme
MMQVDGDIIEALRNETPLKSEKLEVLRRTTLLMLRQRGMIDSADVESFYQAGYSRQNLLDIVLLMSQKVMSNYVNHLADTPVDEPFKAFVWKK